MAALFAACTNGRVKPALSDLFQHGTKCVKLSFREGAVFSVCVGKMGHQAFDLEGTSQERVVEK